MLTTVHKLHLKSKRGGHTKVAAGKRHEALDELAALAQELDMGYRALGHFTVVYDACVLFPAPLRDLLMQLAMTGLLPPVRGEEDPPVVDLAKHKLVRYTELGGHLQSYRATA